MKKLFLILSMLMLAVGMSYAEPIATITNISGTIIVKHNGICSIVASGAPVYDSDEIWLRSTQSGDWVELDNLVYTAYPIFRIRQTDVYPYYLSGRYWYAETSSFTYPDKGDGGLKAIVVPQPESVFWGSVGMCPSPSKD